MPQFDSPEKAIRFVRTLGCLVSVYIVGSLGYIVWTVVR